VLYTFTQTCQGLGVEPWRYLRDVLERLPSHSPERVAELLPEEWAQAQRGLGRGGDAGRAKRDSAADNRPNRLDAASLSSRLAVANRWLAALGR
jgi:hypothetical protein